MSWESVSGRTFREDPTSYKSTGIPRGNPKRYESHAVIRTVKDGRPLKRQNLEEPEEDIETEGDRQLKELLHKQLETDVTAQGQLKRRKDFTQATLYKPLTADAQGSLSLTSYKNLSELEQQIEQLRQCGLSEDDIKFKLQYDTHNAESAFKKSKADPSIAGERIKAINDVINQKQTQLSKPDKFSGAKYMSRHEMDLERAITHDKDRAKMLQCLVTSQRQDISEDAKHPLNNLETIMQNVMPKNKKKGKHKQLDEDETCPGCMVAPLCDECEKNRKEEQERIEAMRPLPLVYEDEIIKNRLTIDEIKQLPKFTEYSPGTPNKTLYVKNLASGVTEKELMSLFGRYNHSGQVKCRLLTGRMRRQAFISLPDEYTAGVALEFLNGYKFKDKPLIIQYSNKE